MNRIGENVWEDVPDSAVDEHYLGDECWCEPITHTGPLMPCHDGYMRPQIVIEHNYRVRVARPNQLGIIDKSTLKGDKNYGRRSQSKNKRQER